MWRFPYNIICYHDINKDRVTHVVWSLRYMFMLIYNKLVQAGPSVEEDEVKAIPAKKKMEKVLISLCLREVMRKKLRNFKLFSLEMAPKKVKVSLLKTKH